MAPIRDMLAESNITEQQWRVLRMLNEHGPQDASTLARRSGLLAPSLSRIVAAMEANGHLVREPDLEDRRRQRIAMTDKGAAIITHHLEDAGRIAARFRKSLGDEDFDQLLDLLHKVARELSDDTDADPKA